VGETQSALIGAFVTVAVMTSILLRRRNRRTDVLFAVLCVTLLLWFVATFLTGWSDEWVRAELATAALIPAALIRLFADLVPLSSTTGRSLESAIYPLSGVVAVIAISPLGDTQPVRVAVAVYVGAVILLASNLMITSSDLQKGTIEYVRRRYVAIGASLVTLLAIAGELPWLDLGFNAMGHLAVMLYVFFLSQVILRDRLLDLNEFIGRMMVMGILATLFAAMFALLISLGSNFSSRLFNAVVGVMILLTLYEPLKVRLEAKTLELFFRERHRFVMTLEDLRRRMHHGVIDPVKMAGIVVDTLYDARRATHAAIYFLDPMRNELTVQTHRGPAPPQRVNAGTSPVLWHAIQQNRTPLLTERLGDDENEGEESKNRDLIDQMRAVSADVLLPFVSGETVLGFLALRDDRSPEPYSTAEIAKLMQIAETAATVIWNSKLMERLRERERLATVGAMAAGLAHEIRNPLGAIKGAAEYLDPGRFLEGDEAEFLQVIIDETNRLNSVVSQFLDYARPFRAQFQETDINEVVRKTAKLIQAEHGENRVTIVLDESVPPIRADGEQMKQVVLNLALNGLDASAVKQRPVVITTRYVPERSCVELRVKDEGRGIPPEDLDRIFIPFFTTKQQGTGLGLAVCQRIVHNHGGTIYPESKLGEWTEFVVVLPTEKKEHGSITGSFARPGRQSSVVTGDLPALEVPPIKDPVEST
jgi:signal transduction histidine kinase